MQSYLGLICEPIYTSIAPLASPLIRGSLEARAERLRGLRPEIQPLRGGECRAILGRDCPL
ncbi:hypothetical protein HQ37_06760 [Porphyromonas sp. COT-239 OH1446]|nr:hypothetical protein HQ37_06760 [Porphyromonas sp. COT-239 OH1446]